MPVYGRQSEVVRLTHSKLDNIFYFIYIHTLPYIIIEVLLQAIVNATISCNNRSKSFRRNVKLNYMKVS